MMLGRKSLQRLHAALVFCLSIMIITLTVFPSSAVAQTINDKVDDTEGDLTGSHIDNKPSFDDGRDTDGVVKGDETALSQPLTLALAGSIQFGSMPVESSVTPMAGLSQVSDEAGLIAAIAYSGNTDSAATIVLAGDIETSQSIGVPAGSTVLLMGSHKIVRANDGPVLSVANNASLTIDGVAITHSPGAYGTGIQVLGMLNMQSGSITANHNNTELPNSGIACGVVITETGVFTMTGGTITNNSGSYGGGVNNSGTFNLCGGSITMNQANRIGFGGSTGGAGGGVYSSGSLNMSAGSISNNQSNRYGGGVYNELLGIWLDGASMPYSNVFTMTGGEITQNEAKGSGGGVFNGGGFVFKGGAVNANRTLESGGAVMNLGMLSLEGGIVSGNSADQGGGVFNSQAFRMASGRVIDNTAVTNGGGLFDSSTSTLVSGGDFSGNTAENGGAIYMYPGSALTLTGGGFASNMAVVSGGGIWVEPDQLDRLSIGAGAMFSNNKASVPFDRKAADDATYARQIHCVAWTSPLAQGYNNYDIGYEGVGVIRTVNVFESHGVVSGAGSYGFGSKVSIDAGSNAGHVFIGWIVTVGNVMLADAASAKTSFVMPASDIAFEAQWRKADATFEPEIPGPTDPVVPDLNDPPKQDVPDPTSPVAPDPSEPPLDTAPSPSDPQPPQQPPSDPPGLQDPIQPPGTAYAPEQPQPLVQLSATGDDLGRLLFVLAGALAILGASFGGAALTIDLRRRRQTALAATFNLTGSH
jgi:hypothetical protein